MKQIDNEKYIKFLRSFPEHYSGESVLAKYNLLKDATELGDQFSLCCPFHNDILPSFRLSKESGQWHCFGCGVGGHLFKLMYMLEGTKIPMTIFADNFLKQDIAMQKQLGFNTIFVIQNTISIETFITNRKQNKFRQDKTFEMPISVLAKKLKSLHNDFNFFASSLEMLQSGVQPNRVYDVLSKYNTSKPEETDAEDFSLSKLIIGGE